MKRVHNDTIIKVNGALITAVRKIICVVGKRLREFMRNVAMSLSTFFSPPGALWASPPATTGPRPEQPAADVGLLFDVVRQLSH